MNCHKPSALTIVQDVLMVAFGAACILAVLTAF